MTPYRPQDIEKKWQDVWASTGIYQAQDNDPRPKYYMLTEFPYPSGEGLHAGHAREYTLGDVIARHKRMQGYNVLYPMGYDAFGLPAENYAIKHKILPQEATARNAANFRRQFDSLGYSFDWSREINTTDPAYYKWTQWLFLKFLEAGLAYQDTVAINWCPHCKTGLANEEVEGGTHERCGTPVEKKELKQWMLRITTYADKLIDGLKGLDYPERVASQQINWIGRSEGAEIQFDLAGQEEKLTVYTTRPDTLFGATFLVIAPELAQDWMKAGWGASDEVRQYVTKALRASERDRQEEKEKTGVDTGIKAVHPLTGAELPVWVADYVLGSYGTGAIMAVPAHDERDFEFARKFALNVVQVVEGGELPYAGPGPLVNSGDYDGLSGVEAKRAIVEKLFEKGVGKGATRYRLRDWVFSRQHYWGEPIPVVHCKDCGVVPVPEDQLPVVLPEVESYEPTETGESPLASIREWVETECPKCAGPAERETDTMPNWAGSSWYYLRYPDARGDEAFASPDKLKKWLPVDLYLGGQEHITLHLLYSRFWHQFLYDQGLVPTPEPYAARRGQGIVLAADGRKMSKSFGNVVNPTDIIGRYGADALRVYLLFMAPYDQDVAWSDERLGGVARFLYRVWGLAQDILAIPQQEGEPDGLLVTEVDREVHKTLKRVHDDLHDMKFNTMVAALMELINTLSSPRIKERLLEPRHHDLARRTLRSLVLMLAPSAPHITEELWHELGEEGSVHVAPWPTYDSELIKEDLALIAVQVNGKLRGQVVVPVDADADALVEAARANENVAKYLYGAEIVKTITVPRKLVNFVVKA